MRENSHDDSKHPRWLGLSVIVALVGLDLAFDLPLLATNGILVVLLGGIFQDREQRVLALAGVILLAVDSIAQAYWHQAVPWFRILVALICFWMWYRLRQSAAKQVGSAVQNNQQEDHLQQVNVRPTATHRESVTARPLDVGSQPEEASDEATSSGVGCHLTGFSSGNTDESSLVLVDPDRSPRTDRMHPTSMLVRLIDTGVFSRSECEVITSILNDAPNLELGLQRCVLYGKLTGFQADCIADNAERRLRVGRYTLQTELGSGGMGTVYRAFDRERNEEVALKLFQNLGRHLLFIRREMSVLQELAHPNLVTAYEVGDADGFHYIAMELLKGDNLFRIVKRDGPFDEATALESVHQVARAMQHMHDRGVVHRDIKPSNVMRLESGRYKLMDVGICRPSGTLCEFDSFDLGDASTYGTIGYAAPEQLDREGKVDYRSDYYSLGSLLFFLLTGQCYLEGGSLRERLHLLLVERRKRDLSLFGFSPRVTDLLQKLLQYEREDRPQSDEEVVELLLDHSFSQDDCRITVMVVEDNPTDVAVAQRVLDRSNHSVDLLHSPTFAGLSQLLEDHPADANCPVVVLLDLNLPDSPVGETLAAITQLVGEQIGVVAVSGDDSTATRQRCLRAGAMEFVSKNMADSKQLERAIFTTASRLQANRPLLSSGTETSA
ncbi:MAG: protein kinase [Rhodopirellula sp. JB044]|uniref:protein kinase domain-containing protein n=1 Tax=Rhodopirellula sp. JB044 TaxID=3342844 RepID=UPI00370A6B4B